MKEYDKYEKIITINESVYFSKNKKIIDDSVKLLFNFMNEHNKKNNHYPEYFHLMYIDSEKNQFGKDLVLRWAVEKKQAVDE